MLSFDFECECPNFTNDFNINIHDSSFLDVWY